MIGPEFASCWLKLGRAEEHLNTIKSELLVWMDSKPYSISRKCDPQGSRYSQILEIAKPAPYDRWSLIAGDCIHNLRSSLDSLVYAVAIRESGSSPPPGYDKLQFPITSSAENFAKQTYRLSSISNGARARIERAQPYNRPHQQLPPLLSLLSELDNLDKHRLLNVVMANVGEGKFSFALPGGKLIPMKIGYHTGAVKSGTEVAYFIMDPPEQNVNYQHEATVVISMEHPAGPSGRTFGEIAYILAVLIAEVRRIVEQMIL